ncbi:hypothetical protein E2C01_040040 [Portunus trituberculatus]|uniref:Uncharacterized protein n=1 Tax=Portunus trituberculatus TaxID=210409 RepID=A0A5B7FIL2_PORTR|nr:hypothetical protein [Portunus trituberculatus]
MLAAPPLRREAGSGAGSPRRWVVVKWLAGDTGARGQGDSSKSHLASVAATLVCFPLNSLRNGEDWLGDQETTEVNYTRLSSTSRRKHGSPVAVAVSGRFCRHCGHQVPRVAEAAISRQCLLADPTVTASCLASPPGKFSIPCRVMSAWQGSLPFPENSHGCGRDPSVTTARMCETLG